MNAGGSFLMFLAALFAAVLFVGGSEAFETRTLPSARVFGSTAGTTETVSPFLGRSMLYESNNDDPILSSSSPNAGMSETSRLSHAMLKVPSVDDSVKYWTSMGGKVVRSKSNGKTNGEAKLLSAFIQIGPVTGGRPNDGEIGEDQSFSLEIVQGSSETHKNQPNHGLSFLGLSMLLKFQNKNPLLEMMTGKASDESTDSPDPTDNSEHNCFPVKYVASAPGDGIAQLALLSDDKLVETCDFYTKILGMDQKAQDTNLLCLRFDGGGEDPAGVATTLVFENASSSSAEGGNSSGCFDHLAICTTSSINGLYRNILDENKSSQETAPIKVYMKPTQMFDNTVLGLIDPNGYRVVVFGSE